MTPRILLVNPWIYDFAAANLWSRPLGLWQVAEWLSAYAADLKFIDCLEIYQPRRFGAGKYPKTIMPKPQTLAGIPRHYGRYGITPDDFLQKLRAALPADAILVTSIMTYWYPGVQEVIRLCKQLAPRTPMILGGIYARLCPEHARRHSGAATVFTGTAGQDVLPVLQQLGVQLNPAGAARPYYRVLPLQSTAYAPLLTSYGCPFHCAYCASDLLFPVFQRRPAEAVWQEVVDLHALGATDFAFYDDALLHDPSGEFSELLERLAQAGLPVRLHTPNGLHARFIAPATARLMRRAGFTTLRLSLETSLPSRQAGTGGKVNNQDVEQAVAALKSAGFGKEHIGVYLLFGLPGQPWEEVCRSVDYLQGLQVKIFLNEFSPIPGTRLWEDLVRSGRIPEDLEPLLTNNSVFAWLYSDYDPQAVAELKRRVVEHNHQN